ncbi:MAG: pilus assembly protein N-terminal domain-containing protein [Pseudomonadota bacterium]
MLTRMSLATIALSFAFCSNAFSVDHATTVSSSAAVTVKLNHARVLKLGRPAGTVIIGNPEIADATVRDPQTIVLTGRAFGTTNMVILDQAGTPIIDENVSVRRSSDQVVTIYRRANIQTLSCEPVCEQAYLSEFERESQARQEAESSSGVSLTD